MRDQLITHRGAVYRWHCDHMGHMNVMWYVGKFDAASNRGMAGVEQRIASKRERMAGDLIFIRSTVLEAQEKVVRFSHEMISAESGEIAATSELTAVHIDRSVRKSCPFPPAVLERARALVASTQT